jgi:hypothetical protein
MSHLLTTMFWNTNSFSGSGQLNEGAFNFGDVNKLFRCHVRGAINFQGASVGDSSVFTNNLTWGVQVIPHGNSPFDVVTSTDDDTWIIRGQVAFNDTVVGWAPNTDTAGVLATVAVRDEWAGQLNLAGANMDCYLSIKASVGSAANFNTTGTIRWWWL